MGGRVRHRRLVGAAPVLAMVLAASVALAGCASGGPGMQPASGTALASAARCALPETPGTATGGTPSGNPAGGTAVAPAEGRPPANPDAVTILWFPGLAHPHCDQPTTRFAGGTARRLVDVLRTAPTASGVRHCPRDTGQGAELFFAYPGGGLVAATVGLSGCRTMTAEGRTLRSAPILAPLQSLAPRGFPRF